MKLSKARGLIILLSFAAVVLSFALDSGLLSLLLPAALLLAAVVVLYRNLGELTDISNDNPKMKTLKAVTIFDGVLLAACVAVAVLTGTGVLRFSESNEKLLAACLTSAVILFLGNISPKLPFNRHTGLRLPWTVTDEDTWIVAHRIVGYLSIPLVLIYIACIPAVKNFAALSITVVLLWVGIPGVLSFVFYQKKYRGKL